MERFVHNYLKENTPNFIYARTYQLILTENCNMNCRYCFEQFKERDTNMTFDTAQKIIDRFCKKEMEMNDGKTFRIHLFGGEPFLNSKLVQQIMDYMDENYSSLNYIFSLVTNGTVYNPYVEAIAKYKDKINFVISLDGREEVHNTNRQNYKRVSQNIKRYQELGFLLQISSTFTKETIGSLYDSFYHVVDELGINRFKYILSLGDEIWLDESMADIFNQQINKICDYLIENQRYRNIKVLNFNYNCFKEMPNGYICNNLNKNISYDRKGNAYNCFIIKNIDGAANYSLGNINTEVKLFNERIQEINSVDYSSAYDECKECPISSGCTRCPISVITESKAKPTLCKMHKLELKVFKRLVSEASKKI